MTLNMPYLLAGALVLAACGDSSGTTAADGHGGSTGSTGTTGEPGSSSSTGAVCADGTILCEGNTSKTCDGLGGFKDEMVCPALCVEGIGCVECLPGDTQCKGNVSQLCGDDNLWKDQEVCDDLQGLACDANAGECVGNCSAALLGSSYIGCDYYPVTLPNLHETQPWVFYYAVVVANTADQPAQVTITRGANQVAQQMVGPNTA